VSELVVEVRRGGHLESLHRVHVAVCRATLDDSNAGVRTSTVAAAGVAAPASFVRSAIKMFQALPLVEDGGVEHFGLAAEEIAVTTASHNGEPFHVAAARSLLRKAGVDEDALACGPHPPMHTASAHALANADQPPARIHNNCSGKHAGMLALATLHGWPLEGYHELGHPVQQRVLHTLGVWSEVPVNDIRTAVDGCGLPTFALPLERVAAACARFATAATDRNAPAGRIVRAMTTHPEYVAGTGRLCTDVMRATGGRVFAKVGAEGYYCAGAPAAGLGIALKVEDGAKRAAEPALLATVRALGLISNTELGMLADYAQPVVLNTRGERVGDIVMRTGSDFAPF
jgi:L-asparaginase II